MSDKLEFTDEEIRCQLKQLGFEEELLTQQFLQHFKTELLQVETSSGVAAEHDAVNDRFDDRFVPGILKSSSSSNVVIEKLPKDAFRWSKFRSEQDNPQRNKENLSGVQRSSSYPELEPQMNSKWLPSDLESNSDVCGQTTGFSSDISSASSSLQARKRKVLRKKHGKVNLEIYGSTNLIETTTSKGENTTDTNRLTDNKSDSSASNVVAPKKWRSVSDLGSTKRSSSQTKSGFYPYTNNGGVQVFKSDPVALFHYYKREWSNFNIPGEKDHRELRWNIRQALSTGFKAKP